MQLERFASLGPIDGLAHAVSTRRGGHGRPPFESLNLGFVAGDDPTTVRANRRRVAEALGFEDVYFPRQVHGREVVRVEDPACEPGSADALITNRPGLLLGVLGADCPGVLLVHPKRRALALVHAGWRGIVAGVVPGAITALDRSYGASADGLVAAVGPGISAPRYEVTKHVADRIASALRSADDALGADVVSQGRPGHCHVDLVVAIRAQLERAGVGRERIIVHGGCTYGEPDTWFSHRRDAGRTGRHAVLAGWRREG